MKSKTPGIILIIIGIIMIAYTGFNLKTTENVVDLGPIKIDQEKNHPVRWSPIIGAVLLVGGVVLIASNKKTSA